MGRLGWLGPAVVATGVAVAGLGAWAIVRGRPQVGPVIDTLQVDAMTSLVVRGEHGGNRAFLELKRDGELVWRTLVPTYAGRPGAPGIAWNDIAVSVRVVRDGRAEVFAVARRDASKLGGFRLAPNHGPIVPITSGPVTLTDHVRSYELVAGPGWHQLVAFDLSTGEGLWRQELGAAPIEDGGLSEGVVWLRQRGIRRAFRGSDGAERL